MDSYKALANAIIELAVTDYKKALKYHYHHPEKNEYARDVEVLEQFFKSGWYGTLTKINGAWLIKKIRCMVREEAGV